MKIILSFLFGLFLSTSVFAQTNLVVNGGFENWDWFSGSAIPWERYSAGDVEKSTDAHNGTYSASLETSDFGNFINFINTPFLTFNASKTYTCSFFYKVKSGTISKLEASLFYMGSIFPETVTTHPVTNLTKNVWNKFEFTYTEQVGRAMKFELFVRSTADAEVLIDDVVISERSLASITKTEQANVVVYPNPTSDYITINGLENTQIVSIYNLDGRLMKQVDIKTTLGSANVDISTFPKGIYILKFSKNGSSVARKIIKE